MQVVVIQAFPAGVFRSDGSPELCRLLHQHAVLRRLGNNIVELPIQLFEFVAITVNQLNLLGNDSLKLA